MAEERRRPEICIVGGGLTGLATAFYLQQQPALRHANIRLIEARQKVGGTYVATAYADAGVLHSLLQAPSEPPQSAASDDVGATLPHDLLSLAQQALVSRLLLKHRSVSAAALQPFKTCNSCGKADEGSGKGNTEYGGSKLPLEFGAAVPHFLAPGGGHLLKLSQQLLVPSQLVTGRKQAASLFSLMRTSKTPSRVWSWLQLRSRESPTTLSLCRPGLSRLTFGQALIAGIRELCRKKRTLSEDRLPKRSVFLEENRTACATTKDMSVSAFAELHSSKALADGLLLPAFSSCSYAGEAADLSTASYFPRAWLLHHTYGSLLRGALAERRAARRYKRAPGESPYEEGALHTDRSFAHDTKKVSLVQGPRLLPVHGCRAFARGHEAAKSVATEGAGVFSPAGGMRQLVEALERHIEAPPLDTRPVSVIRGSRVIKVSSAAADTASCTIGRAAEVVCDNGSRYSCDLVICALHPYDLGALLCGSASLNDSADAHEMAPAEGHKQHCVTGKDLQTRKSNVSTMASLLLAVPCASWVTVHAFAERSVRHANSLGRGCFYGPRQLASKTTVPVKSQEQFTKQDEMGGEAQGEVAQAVAGLSEAIRVAQKATTLVELQLPSNVFPHSHAAAMAAAGLFDHAAALWVTTAPMLHAQVAVRVHHLESLMEQMQHLLLPLQRLLRLARIPYKEQGDDLEDRRAVGLRALGLLKAVAEDAAVRALLREKIITTPDQLLVCSQLSLQAEPQWPLTPQHTEGVYEARQRQRLLRLMQQYEELRCAGLRSCPAVHAACSEVPQSKQAEASLLHGEHQAHYEQLLGAVNGEALPETFAEARLLFHRLRVHNTPWLQVVGPSGSLGEWGAGARVKDACILANQVARQFVSFPSIKAESSSAIISRLNGGWLERSSAGDSFNDGLGGNAV
ncbi:hypothetical protein Esti_001921 [Eimeria stiedai]